MWEQHRLILYSAHYSLRLVLWKRQQPLHSSSVSPPNLHYAKAPNTEWKKKIIHYLFIISFWVQFHPWPPSAGAARSHVPPPGTAKQAGSQQANTGWPKTGQERKPHRLAQNWDCSACKKILMAAKKTRDWPFPQVCPAPVPSQHLLSPSQSRGRAPHIQSSLFFHWFRSSETQFEIPNILPVRKGAREICSQLHFIWVSHKPPRGSLSCYSNANRLLWFFFTSKISPLQ